MILIKTVTRPNARLEVLVTDNGRPVEPVFTGLRPDALRHRTRMIDKYSDGRADAVEATAVPAPRQ